MSDALPVIDSAALPTTAVNAATTTPAGAGQGPPAAAETAVSSGFAPILAQLRIAQLPAKNGVTLTPPPDLTNESTLGDEAAADGNLLPPEEALATPLLPPALPPVAPVVPAPAKVIATPVDSALDPATGPLARVLLDIAAESPNRPPVADVVERLGPAPGRTPESLMLSPTVPASGGTVAHALLDGGGATELPALLSPEIAATSALTSAPASGSEAGRAFAAMLAIDGTVPTAGLNRASPTPSFPVSAPLHDDGFVNELNNRLVWMSRNDVQLAEIRINPPQLGPVEVRVAVSNGETSVFFSSPHAAVREVLEAAIPRLRESFQDQGLMLADAGVNDHPDARRGGDDRGHATGDRSILGETPMEASLAPLAAAPPGSGGNLMLDVYA